MTIRKLPQHLINQLKAGEIVERPASIVKELIENSLDAGATSLTIELQAGGKERIIVRDDGHGVSIDDVPQMIERYATSKIHEADDLLTLTSYGFRGEALAAIAQVSNFSVQTRIEGQQAYQLRRVGSEYTCSPIPFAGNHGTHIIVDQLFGMIPVREKYLKSQNTEWKYIRQLIRTYALIHFDKEWTVVHNSKQVLYFPKHASVAERSASLFQDSWKHKLVSFEYKDQQVHCWGLRGDASLHFPTSQDLYLIVNGRPVLDKLLRKAVLTAYQRQIVPGSYPCVILFLDIDPTVVDVNVHPRKMEVTFLDPGSIFNVVKQTIGSSLGDQKVSYSSFKQKTVTHGVNNTGWRSGIGGSSTKKRTVGNNESDLIIQSLKQFSQKDTSPSGGVQHSLLEQGSHQGGQEFGGVRLGEYEVQVVGQLMNMYIVAQTNQGMLLIDQHALAERITFETMRKQVKAEGFLPQNLLTPLTVNRILTESQSSMFHAVGFENSSLGEKSLVLYTIPSVFETYRIDIDLLLQCLEGIDFDMYDEPYQFFDLILNEIIGMKACKASIKAGQRLSHEEMEQLIRDASGMIEGLFVCQHGRPSVVHINKLDIDSLFDR